MFELAAAYVAIAIGKKLLDHVGDDVGDAFDKALAKLGNWVTAKLRGRPVGDVALTQLTANPKELAPQQFMAAALDEVVTGDPGAADQLRAMIAELEKLKPAGLIADGSVEIDQMSAGKATGLTFKGDAPPADAKLTGRATVSGTMSGGELTGTSIDLRADR
jgi:hypothetical protein